MNTMFKRLISFFILNRVFILILGIFALTLAQTTKSSLMRGDSSMFTIYQGDHIYTYTQPESAPLSMWAVWDTKWYISIADDGYSKQEYPFQKIDNKGFLPLYAILLMIFGNLLFFGNFFLAGVVISNIFLILGIFLLFRLIRNDSDLSKHIHKPQDVFFYILTFPTAYILSAIYPESLFLFLSIAVFYAVHKNKIYTALILFGLACMTKTFGIFLSIPIVIHIYKHKKHIHLTQLISYIFVVFMIPIAYCAYMFYISGDAFAYIHIQEKFFSHSWTNPFVEIFRSTFMGNFSQLWNGWFSLVTLIVLIVASKRIPISYTLYGIAVVLFTPTTGMVLGSSRYIASLFILPLALASLIKHEETKFGVLTLFSVLQGFAIFWWVTGAGFVS